MGPILSPFIFILTGITGMAIGGALQFIYPINHGQVQMATILGKLHTQINSLTGVVSPNWWALELLTKAERDICFFLGEECCFYINRLGKITTSLFKTKQILSGVITEMSWFQSKKPF